MRATRLLAKLFAGLLTLYLVLIWSGNLARPFWMRPDIEPLVAIVAAFVWFVAWWEELLAFARSSGKTADPPPAAPIVEVHVHTPPPAAPQMTEPDFAAPPITDLPTHDYRLNGPDDARLWLAETLLGREKHLAEITAHLDDPAFHALTVSGEAGMGKTEICRLALQNRLRQRPDQPIYWIDVENILLAEGLLDELRKLAALPPGSKEDSILRALGSRPALYYLDNLESAADDPMLRRLLDRLLRVTGARWLASSREAFGGWGRALPLPELDDDNALRLFCRHWKNSGGGDLDPTDAPLRRFVTERLGCHPLSIVLTASHADFPDVGSVVDAWETQWQAVARRHAGDAGYRQDNLDASLRLSLQKVAHLPGALRLWALQILFPQGMDAAQQDFFLKNKVFAADDRAALVQRNILRQRRGILSALPPLARFAEENLRHSRAGFSEAQFFADALPYTLEYAPEGENLSVWLSRLPCIFRLLALYSASPDSCPGYDTLHDRMYNYYNRDPFAGRHILQQLFQKKEIAENEREKAYALQSLGDLERLMSENDKARALYEQALPLFEKVGSDLGKANTLRSLGDLERLMSENDKARALYEQALPLYEKVGSDLGKANTLRSLGDLEWLMSENDKARALYEQALPLFEKVGSDLGKANTLKSLGDLERRMSENDKARALYEQALPLFEKVGSDLGKANTLRSLGDLERLMSENDKARALYEQALPLFEKVGSDLGKANTLRSLGDLERLMSENDKARALYEQALPLFEKVGSDLGKANTLQSLGDLERLMSENDKARALYEQALPLFEKVGDDLGKANTLKSLGDLEWLMSENDKARALYEQALPLFEKVGDDLGKANTLRSLGDLEWRMNENDKARALYEQALPLFEKVGDDLGKANTLRSLGDLERRMSENDKARALYEQALPLYEKVGDDLGKANTLKSLGDLERLMSENDKARALYEQALPLFEKVGSDLGKANTLKSLGDLERRMSENDKARALYEQALPLFEKVGDDLGKANVWWSRGMLAWYNEKNGAQAMEAWEKALALYQKVSYTEYVANTLARMALVWNQSGQADQACAAIAEALALAARLGVPSLSEFVEKVRGEVSCPE